MTFASDKIFISLGCNCHVKMTLDAVGINGPSLPLDWVNSFSIIGALDFLVSYNFSYQDSALYSIIGKDNRDGQGPVLYLPRFNIRMPHESNNGIDIDISLIQDKYFRRLNRFKNLFHSSDTKSRHIFFIRLLDGGYVGCEGIRPYLQNEDEIFQRLTDICGFNTFSLIILSRDYRKEAIKFQDDSFFDAYKSFFSQLSFLEIADLKQEIIQYIYKKIFL